MNEIDGKMIGLLERMLDVSTKRQALIAGNIANVDTPGYQTRDLDFESAMKAAVGEEERPAAEMVTTEPGHLQGTASLPLEGYEFEPSGLPRRNDLNNVSIDREMLSLAKTAGRYNVAIELIRKRIALLKYAIMDGRSGS
jgi:flagellar basal-body rod protein FlgB